MPPEAKVFYVEDDQYLSKSIKGLIEIKGHKVVFEVHDLETALEGARNIVEIGANVAVLDGNLKPKDFSCSDGWQIATLLRETKPDIKIVACSGEKTADYGDIFVSKKFPEVLELPKVIMGL